MTGPERGHGFFCHPPRRPPGMRGLQVLARTIHVAAMALVLGGLFHGIPLEQMGAPLLWTAVSGVVLLAAELVRTGHFLHQGAGVALWVKLLLLGLAQHALPAWRTELYLIVTAIAAVGSHMVADWRHFSFVYWQVLRSERGRGREVS